MKLNKIKLMYLVVAILLNTSLFSQFEKVGNGFLLPVTSLYADSLTNGLIAGGSYKWTAVDSIVVNGVARWDGSNWDSVAQNSIQPIGINVASWTEKFLRFKGDLYAQGVWGDDYEPTYPFSVGKFDTILNKWIPLPCGIGSPGIRCMSVVGDTMFLTGNSDTLCGNPFSLIYGYDGVNLFPTTLSNSLPVYSGNAVQKIFKYKGVIYLVGGIYDPSDSSFKLFLKWNGTNWIDVPGIGGDMVIKKTMIYNNDLYVGGYFFKGQGTPGNCIAKFDGTTWSDVGGGVCINSGSPDCCGADIKNFTFYHGELYVVGTFNYAGGIPAQNIAKWDGTNWCGLGSSIDNTVWDIAEWNDSLYIGGGFKFIDGDSVNYIAKWSGTLGACSTIGIDESQLNNESLNIYPNPSISQITIEFELTETKSVFIEIKNVLGQTIKTISNNSFTKGNNKIEIDVSEFSDGIYFLQLLNTNRLVKAKLIKQ